MTSWRVERVAGSPAEIHALGLADPVARAVRRCEATSPAVVLGSTQPEPPPLDVEDGGGLPLVRRRSGGGAVLVEPGRVLWVDVSLPSTDPLWDDDVARAFHWLGDAWAGALRGLGVDATAHHDRLCTTQWSRHVCFAGVGPGEVVRADDRRKVVGIAQRRSVRAGGALFQCAALLGWDPAPLVERLGLPAAVADDVARAAAALDGIDGDVLFERFVQHLPE